MAITMGIKYYHNNRRIIKVEDYVNMSSYKKIAPLTGAQIKFYEEHPKASVQEVLNCELNKPYVPPLDKYKELKVAVMSELSKATALQKYPQYVRDNIFAGVYDDTDKRAKAMQDYFVKMRDEFYRLKALIENATSIEEVDEICNDNNFDTL